jgi:hypothetical protein
VCFGEPMPSVDAFLPSSSHSIHMRILAPQKDSRQTTRTWCGGPSYLLAALELPRKLEGGCFDGVLPVEEVFSDRQGSG